MAQIRYNNAGNLRSIYRNGKWSTPFIGEVLPPLYKDGSTAGYRKFSTLPYGYRALFIVLKQQYLNKGLNTIAKIFPVYAPASDNNNPQGYINFVEKQTGINRDKVLSSYSDLIPIVEAITKQETGVTADKQAVIDGYKLINSPLIPPTTIQQPTTIETPVPQINWFTRNKKPILITGAGLLILTSLYYGKKNNRAFVRN